MLRKLALTAAAVLVLLPTAAAAQSDNVTVTVAVPSNFTLTVTSGAAVGFSTLGGSTIGPTGATTTGLSFAGNATFKVEVIAAGANFTSASGNNNSALDAADLEWSADGGTTWAALSTTPADVQTGIAPGTGTATINWQLTAPAAIAQDTYTLTVTFTALAN
jgi:hypothetical protein